MAKLEKKFNKTINNDSHINPQEQIKKVKQTALELLEIAKKQETEKKKQGFTYVMIDEKTMVLRKLA